MRVPTLILAAALCGLAAQPPKDPGVEIVPPGPAPKWSELKAPPGSLQVTLRTTDGKAAKWVLVDGPAGLDVAPDGKTATLTARAPGRYRVVAFSDGSDPYLVTVVVGDGVPPLPPPPQPSSPLRDKLLAAYAADPADPATRQANAKILASLYRAAADLALDPTLTGAEELAAAVKTASTRMLKDDPVNPTKLVGVRRAVTKEWEQILTDFGPLTDDQRKRTAALFAEAATILDTF